MLTKTSKNLLLFALIISMSIAGMVHADTLTLGLDTAFPSKPDPLGTAPWITATFDDSFGDSKTVRLTMSASNLIDPESICPWLFNFDPNLNAALLSATEVNVVNIGPTIVSFGDDSFKADGAGHFDIKFDFPPPPGNGDNKFSAGETVIYDLTYGGTEDISASSFNFFTTDGGGMGNYLSAAKIQQSGLPENNDSTWIGVVPEPISSTLFIVGGATLGLRRLRKKRKINL